MTSLKIVFIVGAMALSLAGCSAKPTKSELMLQQTATTQEETRLKKQLAKDWERGAELIKTGEERVEDGEDLVDSGESEVNKGKKAIKKGKNEIAEGKKLMQTSERRFEEAFPKAGTPKSQ